MIGTKTLKLPSTVAEICDKNIQIIHNDLVKEIAPNVHYQVSVKFTILSEQLQFWKRVRSEIA